MTNVTKQLEKEKLPEPVNATAKLDRPRRRSFENPGRLKFPEIPGFHTFVAAVDDPNLPNEYERVEDIGYTPVTAEDIGYDKRGLRPLQKGERIYVNLGRGVKGILMKIPQEWYEEDIAASFKHNNKTLMSTKDSLDSNADKELIMTKGELHKLKS